MNVLALCPCCSSLMLHHISNHREYWFCRNCWQEMPDLELVLQQNPHLKSDKIVNLSIALPRLAKQSSEELVCI